MGFDVYGYTKKWDQIALIGWISASVLICLVTLFADRLLAPYNKAWFQLGHALSKIGNPLFLGIIFFGLLTPVALVLRIFGRDELRLKHRHVTTYWIDRNPPGPPPESFKNQF